MSPWVSLGLHLIHVIFLSDTSNDDLGPGVDPNGSYGGSITVGAGF